MSNKIVIKGARVHNLKNISLELPRDKFIVITGLSGSGKSSLAFDTIYAEGQRRYVESLSAYARQFLGLMDKPDVDQIEGLSPAISIDQKSTTRNPRSTVGTVTEIYDYIRLLFARVGIPHCPKCGREVKQQTQKQMVDVLLRYPNGTQLSILAPMVKDQKGEHRRILEHVQKTGYARVRLDGDVISIEEAIDMTLDKQKKHSIDVIVDRLTLDGSPEVQKRMASSLETSLDLGNGTVYIQEQGKNTDTIMSESFACSVDGINIPPIEPRNFSFNSPHGACPGCSGLGTKLEVDADLVIPNKKLTLAEGAIRPWSRTASSQTWYMKMLQAAAKRHKININQPVAKLTKEQLDLILNGTGGEIYTVDFNSDRFQGDFSTQFEGVIPNLERRYKETDSDYIRSEIEKYMRIYICPKCNGKRLRPEALCVHVDGKDVSQVVAMTIEDSRSFFTHMTKKLTERELKIAHQILKEITGRLKFLHNVGLDYLTLDRTSASLSGGEAQRIRLATQIGSSLVGVIYILDEPSIGLHQRDNDKLIATLKMLRDLPNTVIVVEHDYDTIVAADYVVDIGPGAGKHGGEVVAQGTPEQIKKVKNSLTGQYISHKLQLDLPKKRRKGNGRYLNIYGASEFNLKNVDVGIPLGKFVCLTGGSGSGKSTLMVEILAKALSKHFFHSKDNPGAHKKIDGIEHLDKVINIDQSPIGRTPRSNPATYTGLFTYIRDLYSMLPEAQIRGYKAGRFSFNVKGGRCETCQGDGLVKIEMNFLPDVYVECEECHGDRYNPQALEVHYKGKNISDVLRMTVEEAKDFFSNIPNIFNKLSILDEVGLGYIQLGQSATTLSGGEAQRIKLATELSRRSTGKTLYILDEPTTGLHFVDVRRLLIVLNRLVDKGNTVLVIEHNMDVIRSADWVIDLGPEGGDKGGEVVAFGTPEDIARVARSYTGQYLKHSTDRAPRKR
ncbi:MAG: excinuclease ABC subunit UvrA [Patescibacteria group bacterium]